MFQPASQPASQPAVGFAIAFFLQKYAKNTLFPSSLNHSSIPTDN